MAIVLLALATAATPKSVNAFWFTCTTPQHTHCTSHVMPKHRGQVAHGYWTKCRQRCTVFPRFRLFPKHVVRHVKAIYRQATRAVRAVGQRFWYLTTGYAPPAQCGASGLTASGIMPYYGVAASTLPFGTRGYVPGYGPFVAEDTGGSIGPGHLDLYFPTCSQAFAWGTRSLLVTIY